jgi:hypothetical protein
MRFLRISERPFWNVQVHLKAFGKKHRPEGLQSGRDGSVGGLLCLVGPHGAQGRCLWRGTFAPARHANVPMRPQTGRMPAGGTDDMADDRP